MSLVDGTGKSVLTLTMAALDAFVSAAPSGDTISEQVAGPNLLVLRVSNDQAADPRPPALAIVDRSGTNIGGYSFAGSVPDVDTVHGSPSGTEWTWSVTDSRSTQGPGQGSTRGRILVAGLGIPAHTVLSWAPPAGTWDTVAAWTDMGVVVMRESGGGCGSGFHPDQASFLLDPASGTLTTLFSNDNHFADARHGVTVGFAAQSQSAVLINGRTWDELSSTATSALVSPDGGTVGIGRVRTPGCGSLPGQWTEFVDVTGGGSHEVSGCDIAAWFDATRWVCATAAQWTLRGVDGSMGAALGPISDSYIGTLATA